MNLARRSCIPTPSPPFGAMTAIRVPLRPADVGGSKQKMKMKTKRKRYAPSLVFDRRMIAPGSGTPARTCVERPPVAPPTAGTRDAPCGRDSGRSRILRLPSGLPACDLRSEHRFAQQTAPMPRGRSRCAERPPTVSPASITRESDHAAHNGARGPLRAVPAAVPNSPAATSERPSAADDKKVSGLYAAMTLQASAIFVTRSLVRATGHELGGGRLRESVSSATAVTCSTALN
jgi:hypothetical protein